MFFKRKKLSENEFANSFAEALKKQLPEIDIISIDGLVIVTSNNHKHFLYNSFREYSNNPKNLKEIIQRYILSAIETQSETSKTNPERIIPIIKDQLFLESLEELGADIKDKHIYEQYNSELYIFYAEDKEHSIQYLTTENLEELNITASQLKAIAVENLDSMLTIEKHGDNGYYILTTGGNYEASLILFDIWNKENFPVNGNIVIGIPSRDMLVVTGSQDSKNLHKLYDLIEEITNNEGYLVSDKLYEYIDSEFEIFK